MAIVVIILIVVVIVFIVNYSKTKKKQQQNDTITNQTIEFKSEIVTYYKQTNEEKQEYDNYIKKYPKWYGSKNIKGLCYKKSRIEPLPNNSTEIVNYKTDRYTDLFGRGKDCNYFPGYGKIYNRTFEIWYNDFGSKEKQNIIEYKDIGIDREPPFFTEEITEGWNINNELERKQGFIRLFNVRVEKTRRTWYAGLKSIEFTGIKTESELKDDK